MDLLSKARKETPLRTDVLGALIYGENFQRMEQLKKIFESQPEFEREKKLYMNHTERYIDGCRKAAKFHSMINELGINDYREIRWSLRGVGQILPTDVHTSMFIPTLIHQTSLEQRNRWLDDAIKCRIIGAYAQTELGHGSNVRGLETTATYDKSTQEFVINSPTLTSTKWWPGGLGKTSTHAIVHARLIIDGNDYDIHPFFVQLRSLEDHIPLPGITLGDIGPKLGFHPVDNGFARFHQIRIPRDHLLGGIAEVSADGKYKAVPSGKKIAYGAMLEVRVFLVQQLAMTLARAVTITTRYSFVRKQGYIGKENVEWPVINYQSQQCMLMSLLSWCFALQFTGKFIQDVFSNYTTNRDFSILSSLHAVSSGVKALVTAKVTDSIEICRRLCGGHGYLRSSGIPDLWSDCASSCTFEGTQQILEPQCARYLVNALRTGNCSMAEYLLNPAEKMSFRFRGNSIYDLCNPETLCRIFEARATHHIFNLAQEMSKFSDINATNECAVLMGEVSRAHCEWWILECFKLRVQQINEDKDNVGVDNAEKQVFNKLFTLFALNLLKENLADLLMFNILGNSQVHHLRSMILQLSSELSFASIILTDGWHFSDIELDSALGRFDGNVYPAIYQTALKEPLNKSDVTEGYESLKQLIKAQPSKL